MKMGTGGKGYLKLTDQKYLWHCAMRSDLHSEMIETPAGPSVH